MATCSLTVLRSYSMVPTLQKYCTPLKPLLTSVLVMRCSVSWLAPSVGVMGGLLLVDPLEGWLELHLDLVLALR